MQNASRFLGMVVKLASQTQDILIPLACLIQQLFAAEG
jgi:hypothetical protein